MKKYKYINCNVFIVYWMNNYVNYARNLMTINGLTDIDITTCLFSNTECTTTVFGKLCGTRIMYEFTECNAEHNEPACIEIYFAIYGDAIIYESPLSYQPHTLSSSAKSYIVKKLKKIIPNCTITEN